MAGSPTAKDLFLEALEREGPGRAAFLAELETHDAQLHARVVRLLAAHERAESATERVLRAVDAEPRDAGGFPARIAGYELLEEIAGGGAGIVYRARQVELGRTVAIKLLRAGRLATESEVRRFHAEAEAAARLDHPSIVPVYEVGTHDGRQFISMKLVDGPSLDRCSKLYSDPRRAAELVARVARAVDHGHRHGVLHRDIKPSNVLIASDGTPYVADFGTAKLLDAREAHTLTGCFVGTPSYMAPEQASARAEVTVATDVYALGCLLYGLLVGQPPFGSEDVLEILRQVREDEPVPVRAARPSVPRDLETICHTCLAKEPARRYPTALQLAEDLERWLAFEPIHARPASTAERLRLVWRRKPVVSTLAAIIALLSLVLVCGSIVTGFELRAGLRRTRQAEDLAREQLRNAYVAEARALRTSGRSGQRTRGLELLREAARIRPGLDLVGEATASLALSDTVTLHRWPRSMQEDVMVLFDHAFERYAVSRSDGRVELRRLADGAPLATLQASEHPAWRPRFSRDDRYLSVTHHPRHGSWTDARFVVWDLASESIVYSLDELPGTRRVDFAPDRPAVLLATADGRLFERDLVRGAERTLRLDTKPAMVAYSPDGRTLASIGWGAGPVSLLGLDGELLGTLGDPEERFLAVAWSPRGDRIAAGGFDNEVHVWDVASGERIRSFVGHAKEVDVVLFPRDDVVASFSWDQTTRVWDVETGEQLLVLDAQLAEAAAPHGSRLGCYDDEQAVVLALRHADVLRKRQGTTMTSTQFLDLSPGGKLVATGGDDGFHVWDLASGERLDGGGGHVRGLRFAEDGVLYVSSSRGLERYTLVDGTIVEPPRVLLDEDGRGLDLHPGGEWIAARTIRSMHLFRSGELEPALSFDLPPGAGDVATSPDGRWVALGSWSGSGVHVWRTEDAREAAHLQPRDETCRIAFGPGGRLVVVTKEECRVYRTDGWRLERVLSRRGSSKGVPDNACFSPDERLVALPIDHWQLGLLAVESGAEMTLLKAPRSPVVQSARFTPDGRALVLGTTSGRLLVWDLVGLGRELHDLELSHELAHHPWPLIAGTGAPR